MTTNEDQKPTVIGGIVALITLALAGYLIYQGITLFRI